MTPQELKNSILQRAIQGKLVEQRPEEGTAEELYQQIQAEKQALIKAGKIKKEKPLPEITEEEKPFDIPESWIWCHPETIASVVVGATPSTANPLFWNNGNIAWLPSGCCQDCVVDESNSTIKYISQAAYDSCSTKLMYDGTVMIALTGATAGKVGLLHFTACGNQSIVGISPLSNISSEFVFYQLMARRKEILSDCVGSAQPHISKDYIVKMELALPPLAEQKRIVAKIEELLPLIDRYEAAWSRLEEFNKRFPGDMQKSLLQMAIQGKLVEQRPEEGTGEELYQQIQAEKQALIKAGKIKKDKPLPEITDDEKPFDIPESWKWVRLPKIADMCLGKMLDKQKNQGFACKYLRNVNVRWGDFDLSDLLEMKFEQVDDPRFLIEAGDIVMCEGGEPGRCAVWRQSTPIHFQKALHRIRLIEKLCPDFYYYVFLTYGGNNIFRNLFTGTTIKHLTGQALNTVIVPLPPLTEQKRIVAKLEELLPLCERLK